MPGAILQQARDMSRLIVNSGGFNDDVGFESDTEPAVEVSIQGNVTFHHLGIDPDTGVIINAKQVSILIHVKDLVAEEYPVYRDEKEPNEIVLLGDKCTFKDADDRDYRMKITSVRSSKTFGLISLFFEDLINVD